MPEACAEESSAPIIVLHPEPADARQIAGWLRSAGLGRIATARTCDEALFLLGRQNLLLLIVDDSLPQAVAERLLQHIENCGHASPPMVRLVDPAVPAARAPAAEIVRKPLDAHEMVVRVSRALERPDLLGRMDRDRDQSAANLATARRMQLGLLPTSEQLASVQAHCAACVAGFCRSGEAVGGDFWGVWPTGRGRLALALADFAGHGLSAALNTFRLHAILSAHSLPRGMPLRMTKLLNQRLHALLQRGQYATMIYAQIDPVKRHVEWCSAGGPPPLFVSTLGAQDLVGRGLPLGIKSDADYDVHVTSLPGAGVLCLFSDGLYESGAGLQDIPRGAIAEALLHSAQLAASGQLAEAARCGVAALAALRDLHPSPDHSDDVMVVCVAIG